jgi:hypothetical protein
MWVAVRPDSDESGYVGGNPATWVGSLGCLGGNLVTWMKHRVVDEARSRRRFGLIANPFAVNSS